MTVISSLFAMKIRPFSKSHQNFELGGFSIGYVIATSEPAIAKSHLSVRQGLFLCHYMTNFELGGFSIGYVIATSEPADSQVSSFSSTRTISLSLVASQSVMSLRPLNRQIAKSHFLVRRRLFLCHHMTNFELGGFSICYVMRPLNWQVARSHLLVQQGLFSQRAAIQLESKNSEDEISWKCNRGVKIKSLFIDFKKRDTWRHILQAMIVLHKI